MVQVLGSSASRYFTYDGEAVTTPSMEIRFGIPESCQLTRTAWCDLSTQPTVTADGALSDEQAVSSIDPTTAVRTAARTRERAPDRPVDMAGGNRVIQPHLPLQPRGHG